MSAGAGGSAGGSVSVSSGSAVTKSSSTGAIELTSGKGISEGVLSGKLSLSTGDSTAASGDLVADYSRI